MNQLPNIWEHNYIEKAKDVVREYIDILDPELDRMAKMRKAMGHFKGRCNPQLILDVIDER